LGRLGVAPGRLRAWRGGRRWRRWRWRLPTRRLDWARRLGRAWRLDWLGRGGRDDRRRRGGRGGGALPVEPFQIALRLHESLNVWRVPREELRELLTAAAERASECLDLVRDAKRPERAGCGGDVLVGVDLPAEADVPGEVGQGLRRRRSPQTTNRTP